MFLILLQCHWPTLTSLKHQASKLSLFSREVFIIREWKQHQNGESSSALLFMLCGRWIRAGERSTDACYQPWQSYRDLQCSINLVNWIPNPDCWALGKKQTMLCELFCNAGLAPCKGTALQTYFGNHPRCHPGGKGSTCKGKKNQNKFPVRLLKLNSTGRTRYPEFPPLHQFLNELQVSVHRISKGSLVFFTNNMEF